MFQNILLFLAKVLDQTLSTSKTIFIQRNHGLLAAITLGLSDIIYLTLIKNVVVADSFLPILIVAFGGAVGCWLTVKLNDHFSKDRLYINTFLCDNRAEIRCFAEYLLSHNITCMVQDAYTKELGSKTLSLTAYAETKDESRIINKYVDEHPVFKHIIKK